MNEYNKALDIDANNVEALVARGALWVDLVFWSPETYVGFVDTLLLRFGLTFQTFFYCGEVLK